jgi:hypothetical protein
MRILIGIPCYQNVSAETLEDYMRFAYYCGRRLPEHEFVLGVKSKSEQFRARNAIVEGALQMACDYVLFLDDDHVIDWETTSTPNSRYGMVGQFLKHFEADEKIGIVGAVYYHRGAECRPVLMKEGNDGGFYWMRDDEIRGELQEVAVQGGGCMMMRLSMFDRIKAPWFEPEFDLGTDIQICKKAREAGFKVCCDTSIQIGHVLSRREVVTPQNRLRISTENARQSSGGDEGIDRAWQSGSALSLFRADAEEYLGMTYQEMGAVAVRYDMRDLVKYKDDLKAYYGSRGREQLARQVLFHHTPGMRAEMEFIHSLINTTTEGYGAEYGCGSAPVSFELALRGHRMDFIDIEGSGAYEFTKWRAIEERCGWELKGPYDYVLMLDSIEHIVEWREVLAKVIASLKEGGGLITNYFRNEDYANPEHVSMDKQSVKKFLIENGAYPINDFIWVRKDLGFMDRREEVA